MLASRWRGGAAGCGRSRRGNAAPARTAAASYARTMADVHTPEQRRRNMSAIRSKDTKPELAVRRIAHRLGRRFRLHRADLPGRPDIVFPRLRRIVDVRGCYWHMHDCPYGRVKPKANADFWEAKRAGNVRRDERNAAELKRLGWRLLVVWECETRDPVGLEARLREFLADPPE